MKKQKLLSAALSFILAFNSILFLIPLVKAGEEPYQKTFIITAYYSPLPDQEHYVTGTFEGDKRLNGNGIRGADKTPVYEGMIAAPNTYSFGTRISCAGLIDGEVHDRGGAIVKSGVRNNTYDRLDIWAGYGEEALKKALVWGKRTATCSIYPKNTESFSQYVKLPSGSLGSLALKYFKPVLTGGSVVKSISTELLEQLGYNPYQASARIAFQIRHQIIASENDPAAGNIGPWTRKKLDEIWSMVKEKTPEEGLEFGDTGNEIKKLQEILMSLGLLSSEATGKFGNQTREALIAFQLNRKLIEDASHKAAGYLGPGTRKALQEEVLKTFSISEDDRIVMMRLDRDKILAQSLVQAEALNKEIPENGESNKDFSELILKTLGDQWIKEHEEEEKEIIEASKGSTITLASKEEKSLLADRQFQSIQKKLLPVVNPFDKSLKVGIKHPQVKKLQEFLQVHGYFTGEKITENFGHETKKALIRFQVDQGVLEKETSPGAGIVGPKTLNALNALYYADEFSDRKTVAKSIRAPAIHPDDLKIIKPLDQANRQSSRGI